MKISAIELTSVCLLMGICGLEARVLKTGEKDEKDDKEKYKCPDLKDALEFDENDSEGVASYYMDGTGDNIGDRSIWNDYGLYNSDGDKMGTSSGICTVLSLPDTEGKTNSYCSEQYTFTGDHGLRGSTLLFEGIYYGSEGGDAAGHYTITGGTGCFSGVAGMSHTSTTDGITYKDIISIEHQ